MKSLLTRILLIALFASFISFGLPTGTTNAQQKDDKKEQKTPGEKPIKPTKGGKHHRKHHRKARRKHHRRHHIKHHGKSKTKTDKKDNKDNGKK